MQRRQAPIDPVQVANEPPNAAMQRIFEKMPIQTAVMVPFALLAKLTAHEQQFLAWMAKHEAVIGAQVGKLLPAITRHPAQQRAFSVHNLVMAQRQDEIFTEGIEQTERDVAVMPAPKQWIVLHVAQRVVHPPHVPFIAEAKAADICRPRHAGPGRRLLRNRRRPGMLAEAELVQSAQEGRRLEILITAVDIGNPFARLAAVIEIEHRRNRIDVQSAEMELLQPIERATEKKIPDLASPIVVDQSIPVFMEALARVGVLIEVGP